MSCTNIDPSFITGYWIWNKILENLATLGYDPYVLTPVEP